MHRVGGDHTAGPGACLTGQSEGALDDQRCGPVRVGVVGHHHRVLAAHLQLHPPVRSDPPVDGPPHAGRPGEGDGGDPVVGGHCGARGAVTLDQRDGAGRQPAGQQGLHQALPHQWGQLRRLEQHRVSDGQGGPELAGRNVEREVPRRDGPDDADGFAHRVQERVTADGIGGPTASGGFGGVETQVRRRAADLHRRLGDRFALFAHQFVDQLRTARFQMSGSGFQHGGAPFRGGRRPVGCGLVQVVDRCRDVARARCREGADDVGRVRRVTAGEGLPRDGGHPGAADEVQAVGHACTSSSS